ncbi:MAG TPA: alpha/beta fold hydrolase [Marmoricola sp.]|jgi:pimeloyl-ACP methyl ester carboxylesterase|nr:alpha/beta fold hydrolase [Marmoricola sp.]
MHVVLVPGAGGTAWFWHRVVPLLEEAGHTAAAIDLPGDDEAAGLPEYAELVLAGAAGHDDVVLVGQSIGGFTVPLVARELVARGTPPRAIVLLNAMIPAPGETPGAWWDDVDQATARVDAARAGGWSEEFDLDTYFLHDVDPAVAAEGEPYQRPEADVVFSSVCDIGRWPDIPTVVISGADDRFFPLPFQQRIARERLGVEPRVVPGGHLAALSQPGALVDALLESV